MVWSCAEYKTNLLLHILVYNNGILVNNMYLFDSCIENDDFFTSMNNLF